MLTILLFTVIFFPRVIVQMIVSVFLISGLPLWVMSDASKHANVCAAANTTGKGDLAQEI